MSSQPRLRMFEDPAEPPFWTVSELTLLVKAVVEEHFPRVAVVGEITNYKKHSSGHCYFQLKDEGAVLDAKIWKSVAGRLKFELRSGMAVRAQGRLEVYAPHGKYSLTIDTIEPDGIGVLELAFRQRVEKLRAEGLFGAERKRPLPRFPRRIVVITSPTGAVIRDILQIAARRWRAVEILVAPVRVQGEQAAGEIARAFDQVGRLSGVDVVLLARGGGSLEDLWAFNEEVVARAIAACPVPVVSAIGHETDTTIADLVADLRAPTPSAGAELILPDLAPLRELLDREERRLAHHLGAQARLAEARLGDVRRRLHGAGRTLVGEAKEDLSRLECRLRPAVEGIFARQHHRLAEMAGRLEALSPLGVLARGYSLTFREHAGPGERVLLREAGECQVGDVLRTRLSRGTVTSRVTAVEPEEPLP